MPENNPAGVRVFSASNRLFEGEITKKKHTQITYITNTKIHSKNRKQHTKMMQFFWFLPNPFGPARPEMKKIRASIFMRYIFLQNRKNFNHLEQNKNSPHLVSTIGKHLQILRDCDFITAATMEFVLIVRFYFVWIFERTNVNVTWLRPANLFIIKFHFSNDNFGINQCRAT